MNIEALNEMKRVLSRVPPEEFNMNSWWDIGGALIYAFPKDVPLEKPCGTAGCAIGWAVTDPYFKAKGLGLRIKRTNPIGYVTLNPHFKDAVGFEALAQFFEFPDVLEVEWLFDPAQYSYEEGGKYADGITLEHVIARIDMVLDEDESVGDEYA